MTIPEYVQLGAALRALRTRAVLTQDELATRAKIDAPYLSRIEGGWRDIRWSTLQRLLDALGSDMRQLADTINDSDAARPVGRPPRRD